MAKKDKKEPQVPRIPDELRALLVRASQPPQKVTISEDSRSSAMAVMAETIAVGFQVIGVMANHLTTAPNYVQSESRQ